MLRPYISFARWYRSYVEGEITLDYLEKKAPLIARAVKKQQQAANQP
jgi:hypothetical protein